ncbi:hypothetical protein ACB496_15490 [Lelliottia nimipressuralis]|uniref:hypothetical protein n=1 Tax=Lelliottia nimipressuralis TaxID=69220 RepID=UPI003558DDAC
MKWIRYAPLTVMFAVTPILAETGNVASDNQALQSLSDILTSESDVPALLGVVPGAADNTASVKSEKKAVVSVAGHQLSAVDRSQLMTRLRAQQLRTQQLTATIASLNARLKTMVSETALSTQKHAFEESQKQVKALSAQLSAAQRAWRRIRIGRKGPGKYPDRALPVCLPDGYSRLLPSYR